MAVTHAPFVDGNLQEYSSRNPNYDGTGDWTERRWTYDASSGEPGHYREVKGEWRKIEPFSGFMFFDDWERGRSAVRLWWRDQDGHKYPMFMKDFADILHAGKIGSSAMNGKPTGSSVFGFWTVQKRGANYGIRLLTDAD